jgi:23S rRNA (cytidine1920-2'-O)/16S rRNA (cytidine1409-2'-O)-methyltransferase
MARKRLDVLLVERGLAESRTRAQALIMAGRVRIGNRLLIKPGDAIDEAADLTVEQPETTYVSRGGEKLAHALDRFALDVAGLLALDVGASTGGFTDVLLRRGARRVYAVDVGYGDLAWSLRQDQRVVVMERTNIRYLTALPEQPDLAVIDVSFISLEKVLPMVRRLLAPQGQAVALIKPQFEAGREAVGKGGIVRDPATHRAVLRRVLEDASAGGWHLRGLTTSPILGRSGNREFLALWSKAPPAAPVDIATAIEAAMAE